MTTHIGFLLIEDFSMLSLSAMTSAFRSANRQKDQPLYQWSYLSYDDNPVSASDGISIPVTMANRDAPKFDYLFVVAGLVFDPPYRSRLNSLLHRLAATSDVVGGLSAGPYILAQAGLLKGYEFTLHWEYQPAFSEVFPELTFNQNLNVIDRNRWTSSGGIACMDLALQIVEKEHGRALSNAVANQFQLERVRGTRALQRPFELEDYATLPSRLQTSIRLMDANIEHPLSIPEIADQVGTTVRSLERLFNKFLDCGPAAFYRRMRLERARHLLWHTNLSVLEISFMTGFSSPSYLSRMYQVQYGKIPSQERR